MKKTFIVHTDGASRGNPGSAGAGAVITGEKGEVLGRFSRALGIMTNNEAEYEAVLLGIEGLRKNIGRTDRRDAHVEMRMDSEFVAKQLQGVYQVREERIVPYFMKIWNARVKDFPLLSFRHIPRDKNKEADRLANEAIDSESRLL